MDDDARRLGALIAAAWRDAYGPSQIQVPMSMAAGLALFDTPTPEHAPTPMAEVVELEDRDFLRELYARWNLAAYTWPRLHHLWLPFFEWPLMVSTSSEERPRLVDAARRIGALAVGEGLADLVSTPRVWMRSDLLGHILNPLHAQAQAHSPNPQPTPPLVEADNDAAWAHQLYPGAVVEVPAAWSGTRIMHLARGLHDRGIDPRTLTWRLRATDPVAAATLAASCALWGMSGCVVIGTSTDDSTWVRTAEREIQKALNRRRGHC